MVRTWIGFVAAVAVPFVACGATVEVVAGSSQGGGTAQGGVGGATAASASGDEATTDDGAFVTGAGAGPSAVSTTGGPSCEPCAQALMNGAIQWLCAPSKAIYDALIACFCTQACPMECADSGTCKNNNDPPSDACITCADSWEADGGSTCAAEIAACQQDQ